MSYKRALMYIISAVTLLAASICILSSCGKSDDDIRYVRILVTEADGMTISGENPVLVAAGEDARIPVDLRDDIKISGLSADAVYEDGCIVLYNAQYPKTISVETAPRDKYVFHFIDNYSYGHGSASVKPGTYYEGTEITLTATPKKDMYFIGFSKNNPLSFGGEIVSSSPEYTFALKENSSIFANFSKEPVMTVVYHGNGGVTSDTGDDTFTVSDLGNGHLCPNTLIFDDKFVRDGYQILGYNTKPDGSGRHYGAGWNIVMDEGMTKELYVTWIEESDASDFVCESYKKRYMVTEYLGDDETVVIPAEINGKKVAGIRSGAFDGKNVKTVVIGKNITTIESAAFTDCDRLETIYLTDSIISMTDSAISELSTVKKLYINAATAPSFTYGLMGSGAVKTERLLISGDKPRVFIIAGSSSLYGIDYDTLVSGLGGKYECINYGNHAYTPSAMYMELAAAFTKPDDIIITAPEPLYEQWGDTSFNVVLYQIFEGAYEAFSYIDISHFENVFSSFAQFNKGRVGAAAQSYSYMLDGYSDKGQYDIFRQNASKNHVTYANGVLDFSKSFLDNSNVSAYNSAAKRITDASGIVLMSFSPVNKNALSDASKNKAYRNAFVKRVSELYDCVCISDVNDYIYSGMYFYDTDLHMTTQGAKMRTEQLVSDIKSYLEAK